jgi:hypothetical protein
MRRRRRVDVSAYLQHRRRMFQGSNANAATCKARGTRAVAERGGETRKGEVKSTVCERGCRPSRLAEASEVGSQARRADLPLPPLALITTRLDYLSRLVVSGSPAH